MDHKTTTILACALTLALGIAIGTQVVPKDIEVREVVKLEKPPIEDCPNPTSSEIQDDSQSREYYEKAMGLFIAALGLKLTSGQSQEMDRMLANPKEYVPTPELEVAAKETHENSPEVLLPTPTSTGLYFDRSEVYQKVGKDGRDIFDQELVSRGLKRVIREPAIFFAKSSYSEDFKLLRRINGSYRGSIYLIAGPNKGRTDIVTMTVDFRRKGDNKIDGEFQLILSSNGEVYSESNGSGGNGDVRVNGEEIIIEAGPERFFHFLDSRLTMANFYIAGQFVGVARFTRD